MSNNIDVAITGFDQLVSRIQAISSDKKKKAEVISLLRQIASGTVSVAKRMAPVSKRRHIARGKMISPGNLRKSIGVIVGRKGNAKLNPTVYVGPRAKGNNDGWYGHFVELDHNIYRAGFRRNRSGNRDSNSRGSARVVAGKFFMKKTYDQTQGKVTAETEQKVARYIQKKIDQLSR